MATQLVRLFGLTAMLLSLNCNQRNIRMQGTVSVGRQWCEHSYSSDVCSALVSAINPLMATGNHSATSNNMELIHWPLMGGLLHLVQRGGDWVGPQPAQAPPRCTKCNRPPINGQCTITVLLYNGPLLCELNVRTKGLNNDIQQQY